MQRRSITYSYVIPSLKSAINFLLYRYIPFYTYSLFISVPDFL
jgi:hypothetical protein